MLSSYGRLWLIGPPQSPFQAHYVRAETDIELIDGGKCYHRGLEKCGPRALHKEDHARLTEHLGALDECVDIGRIAQHECRGGAELVTITAPRQNLLGMGPQLTGGTLEQQEDVTHVRRGDSRPVKMTQEGRDVAASPHDGSKDTAVTR